MIKTLEPITTQATSYKHIKINNKKTYSITIRSYTATKHNLINIKNILDRYTYSISL